LEQDDPVDDVLVIEEDPRCVPPPHVYDVAEEDKVGHAVVG